MQVFSLIQPILWGKFCRKIGALISSGEEQQTLQEMLRKETHNNRVINRARILLLAHRGRYNHDVAEIMGITLTTVANIRKRYAQEGLKKALYDRPHPRRHPRLDGHREAYLIVQSMSLKARHQS
jgi:hypothetical protein